MKIAHILTALMIFFSSTSWSSHEHDKWIILQSMSSPIFNVDVACHEGVSQIGLIDEAGTSYLSIGFISREGGVAEPTTHLLSSEVRSWIAKEILFREGVLQDDSHETDVRYEISSCLNWVPPGSDSEGTAVCYPDKNTDCSLFEWACEVMGGHLGHNICTW